VKYLADFKNVLKYFFLFREPEKREKFILKEKESEKLAKKNISDKKRNGFLDYLVNKRDTVKENKKKDDSHETKLISKKLSDNIDYLKKIYSIPKNGDIVLREFDIVAKDKIIPACIIFYDGMTDRNIIDLAILQPLMLLSNLEVKGKENELSEYVSKHLLVHNQTKVTENMGKVIDEINFGGCGVFIDGIDVAFACDVKGWEHRGVDRPETESVVRGPQEGFTETLRTNTALVRKILKDDDLIAEDISIGKRSKTPCSLLYIKDIANDSLVDEVRRRLKGIKVDYIFDSGELEQYLEDNPFMTTPQIIATERPDRVAAVLTEGKVAVIMSGSPFALIMPTTNFDLLQSAEDTYMRFPYVNLIRIVRTIAIFVSLLLPGLYVAITNFHHEMIPTDLLLAIEASRERVPFPSVVEILIMEFAFELILEAGIRRPGPLGPTLGIIGALILGQAAVAASIVSPILIIIVAVTGIGSFAIPNFGLGLSFRLLRFIFIFLASIAGFLGITFGLFIYGVWSCSVKSFGVPFMAPIGPKTNSSYFAQFVRSPLWKNEKRNDYLNVKNVDRQPRISRQWSVDNKKKNKQ
jgi:spore germination protein KA